MAPETERQRERERQGETERERVKTKPRKKKSKTNKIVKEKVVKGNNHKSQSPIIIKDRDKTTKRHHISLFKMTSVLRIHCMD